jgi:hypothetical protein
MKNNKIMNENLIMLGIKYFLSEYFLGDLKNNKSFVFIFIKNIDYFATSKIKSFQSIIFLFIGTIKWKEFTKNNANCFSKELIFEKQKKFLLNFVFFSNTNCFHLLFLWQKMIFLKKKKNIEKQRFLMSSKKNSNWLFFEKKNNVHFLGVGKSAEWSPMFSKTFEKFYLIPVVQYINLAFKELY